MSNIFYSNVDPNLKNELNARGRSGYNRTTKDLQFMLEKIANVELEAFDSNDPAEKKVIDTISVGTLGGNSVRDGRYLPTGPDGFLNDTKTYEIKSVSIDPATGVASNVSTSGIDSSRRTGPYITDVEFNLSDHSMGLLNKATVQISIPAPERDLDSMEDIWFRPGRSVRITITHPNSAIITDTKLSGDGLPNYEKLKELYPQLENKDKLAEFKERVLSMNTSTFNGLITSFEFSYLASGVVEASISLTGTSNTYIDTTMYLPNAVEIKPPDPTTTSDITIDPVIKPTAGEETDPPGESSFFNLLYKTVDAQIINATGKYNFEASGCIVYKSFTTSITDQLIVFGDRYQATAPKPPLVQTNIVPNNFSRYITLGALIQFINDYPIANITGSLPMAAIICDDTNAWSNSFDYITSCIPDDILFLSKTPDNIDEKNMSVYGINGTAPGVVDPVLAYYKNLTSDTLTLKQKSTAEYARQWPGLDDVVDGKSILYPSRILINIEIIQEILIGMENAKTKKRTTGITSGGSNGFTLKYFLQIISSRIEYASAGAISLALVSYPTDPDLMFFKDTKFIKPEPGQPPTPVKAYSVPMMANHEFGTIVKEFKLQATLPESAKNLSYVLNQDPSKISELDIAPYMNYMYNAKDAASINKIAEQYTIRHTNSITELLKSKKSYGLTPNLAEKSSALHKQLATYLQFPTDDIRKSAQLTAPIFPFSAEFTIDGINGFKYGDVLTFDLLPTKYRVNTVFSVIGITHKVGSDGGWYTTIRCIMRPSID
jgi:hypothetical protein